MAEEKQGGVGTKAEPGAAPVETPCGTGGAEAFPGESQVKPLGTELPDMEAD